MAYCKKDIAIQEETNRYFNEVCVDIIKKGEDAVDSAFWAWREESHKESMDMIGKSEEECEKFNSFYTAHMRAWKAAVAVFRNIMPSFGTELVNSQIIAEIQALEVA